MTRAQTTEVLNDTTSVQSRIDTVLSTPVLDWANDSGWHPGDPLYDYPNPTRGEQYTRRMLEVIDTDDYWMRCEPCQVSWGSGDTCWNCGVDYPRPSYGQGFMLAPGSVTFDETYTWRQANLQPFIEQMQVFTRGMAAAADFAAVELRMLNLLNQAQGRTFTESPREPERHPMSRCVLVPHVEDVNAPTVAEIEAAMPLIDMGLWTQAVVSEPVIRIPAGAEITPVTEVPLPEPISVTGRRRRPLQPQSRRFYFDRPVTEQRRPR